MKILFVCEGNINRSQMAETFLHGLRPDLEVRSAGTRVPAEKNGRKLRDVSNGKGIAAMDDIGIDMREKTSDLLTPGMVEWSDRTILLGPTPGGPLPEFLTASPKLEIWDILDPGYGEITHVATRDAVREKIEKFVATFPA